MCLDLQGTDGCSGQRLEATKPSILRGEEHLFFSTILNNEMHLRKVLGCDSIRTKRPDEDNASGEQ